MRREAVNVRARREKVTDQLLVPLAVNLLSTLLVGVVTFFLSRRLSLHWWTVLAIVGAVFVVLLIVNMRRITVRSLRLRVYKEVSASKCNDCFINLATYAFAHASAARSAVSDLQEVTAIRKHPNLRHLQPIEKFLEADTLPSDQTRQQILRYLDFLRHAKALARQEVVQNLARFLRDAAGDTSTFLVLYGYSSTVCDAIVAAAGFLPGPVFLIEDLQYGVEGSLGEHEITREHLRKGSIEPTILPFDQITKLRSEADDFVHSVGGKLVPLAKKRRVLSIIGCEASDSDGNVLIVSQFRGRPSETAKFVEVFSPEAGARSSSVSVQVVVATESYKVHRSLPQDASITHAPIKASWIRGLLYLLGVDRAIRPVRVELVRLHPADVYAVVDDCGIHLQEDGRIDLAPSFQKWERQTRDALFPVGAGTDVQAMFQGCTTIICDVNGVLTDDEAEHFMAFTRAFRDLGINLQHQEYLDECAGLSDEEGVQSLLGKKNLKADVREIVRAKQEWYRSIVANGVAPAFPGAIELLRRISGDGKTCFLVTSAAREEVEGFLAKYGFDQVFPPGNRYFEVRAANRREIYQEIVRKAGGDAARCILFDDTPANLAIAGGLGFKTVGFATTRSAAELQADVVVSGARELFERYAA